MNGKELTLSIISFVLSIISIVIAWYGWYSVIAMATAISSVVLSSLVIKSDNNNLAIAGMILAIAGIICALIGMGTTLILTAIQ